MAEPSPQGPLDEATIDLLVKQVTEGLSPAEHRALDVLDSAVVSANLRALERAAAAIALGGSVNATQLPADLALRITRQAEQHFVGAEHAGAGQSDAGLPGTVLLGVSQLSAQARTEPRVTRTAPQRGNYGWLAAAACLVLAVFAWNRSPPPAAPAVTPPLVAVVTSAPEILPVIKPPTPAEERAALLAKSDSLKITFGATKDPRAAGVSGDVVWDPVTQRGFLHFVGLAANDPALRQYQLWIFDGGRNAGSFAAMPTKCRKPRCVTGSHTTSPLTPAAAGSLVAPKLILSESDFASSVARSSVGVGGGVTTTATGGVRTTGAAGGGERFQANTASTRLAAAASQP